MRSITILFVCLSMNYSLGLAPPKPSSKFSSTLKATTLVPPVTAEPSAAQVYDPVSDAIAPPELIPPVPQPPKKKAPVNRTLRNLSKMRRAGTSSAQRLTHSSLGLVSVGLGGNHMWNLVSNGYWADISQEHALFMGVVHILAGIMGTTRLEWSEKEYARNAQIFPNPITNSWLLAIAFTQFGLGDQAFLDMNSDFMVGFTGLYLAISALQTAVSFRSGGKTDDQAQQSGFMFKSESLNLLTTASLFTLPLAIQGFAVLFLHNNIDPSVLNDFIAAHPDYAHHVMNCSLNNMFINNFGILQMSLMRYRAINIPVGAALAVAPTLALAIGNTAALFMADGGTAGADLLHLYMQG